MQEKPLDILFWWDPNARLFWARVFIPWRRGFVPVLGSGDNAYAASFSALREAKERGVIY